MTALEVFEGVKGLDGCAEAGRFFFDWDVDEGSGSVGEELTPGAAAGSAAHGEDAGGGVGAEDAGDAGDGPEGNAFDGGAEEVVGRIVE